MANSADKDHNAFSPFGGLLSVGGGEGANALPQVYVVGMPCSGKSALIAAVMREAPVPPAGRVIVLPQGDVPSYSKHAFQGMTFLELPTAHSATPHVRDSIGALQAEAGNPLAVIWYCINSNNHDSLESHVAIIEALLQNSLPLALVCTCADVAPLQGRVSLFRAADARFPQCPCFFTGRTCTWNEVDSGIHKLTEWSAPFLTQADSAPFHQVRRIELEACADKSLRCVSEHTAGGFAAGAIPAPFVDAPSLMFNQLLMMRRLGFIWNISELRQLTVSSVVYVLATQLGRSLMRCLLGNALKLIPGVGSAAGCAVNAVVAAALVGSTGYGLHLACKKCVEERMENREFSLLTYLKSEEFQEMVRQRGGAVASEYAEQIRPMVPVWAWERLQKWIASDDRPADLESFVDMRPQPLHCCGVDAVLLEKTGGTSCCNIFIHGFSSITSAESAARLLKHVGQTAKGTNVLLYWQCGNLTQALKSLGDSAKDTFHQAMQRVETLSLLFDLLIEKALRGRHYAHVNIIAHSLGARMTVRGLQHCGHSLKTPLKNVMLMGGCVAWPEGGLPILQAHGARCFNMYNPDVDMLFFSIPRDWALAANPFDDNCIGRVPIEQAEQPVCNIRCEGVGHDYWPHVHCLMEDVGFWDEPDAPSKPDKDFVWRPRKRA